MSLRSVTLELSLKPFGDPREDSVRATCAKLFDQWRPLLDRAEQCSVLLWCADGSELLDYRADPAATFEWAYWIGGANPRHKVAGDPDRVGLHQRSYRYLDDPPELTYGWLARLVAILKQTGGERLGKPIRVGETFDPGPEFARSAFKYERHNEICSGTTMGQGSFVCAYATLHADDVPYAGFPDGIPEGTPFGTFLGRQAQHFLTDLGFDYLWLSNGFGFGLETWALRGALFDGRTFDHERREEVRDKVLAFWHAFRAECPSFPIETRGTNLSTGIDLASDGVPLRDIYRGGFGLEPPPNSPWAAINGDFGLELVGWMSHIAELPGDGYPFRFYTHDPWWANSPWLDRYDREPHDLYLPLSVCRLDQHGQPHRPTCLEFLTADDSWGRLPDVVPREVSAHLLAAWDTGPDQPGPVVWVYPFDEYHDLVFGPQPALDEVFFGDWYLRGAVNCGAPVNTVISTGNLLSAARERPEVWLQSILISPVPTAGSAWAATLLELVRAGGRVVIYGPLTRAGDDWLDALRLDRAAPLAGELALDLRLTRDRLHPSLECATLLHPALFSGGGLDAVARDGARVLADVEQSGQHRAAAVIAEHDDWQGGRLAWVRGTVSCDPERVGGHLLVPYNVDRSCRGERLLGLVLAELGCEVLFEKSVPDGSRDWTAAAIPAPGWPLTCISRHRNAFFFAGYTPVTTVATHYRMPAGAPLLHGHEAVLVEGRAVYHMPRAWRRECRVFVEQESGEVGCRVRSTSESIDVNRRLLVTGLRDAVLRFFHEPGTAASVKLLSRPVWPYLTGDFLTAEVRSDRLGEYHELRGLSGDLLLSWWVDED